MEEWVVIVVGGEGTPNVSSLLLVYGCRNGVLGIKTGDW
jgi:hypothetical protein